jgi:hypothetical protein
MQYTVHNTQYTIHDTQSTIQNIQYTIHNIQYRIHNTQNKLIPFHSQNCLDHYKELKECTIEQYVHVNGRYYIHHTRIYKLRSISQFRFDHHHHQDQPTWLRGNP